MNDPYVYPNTDVLINKLGIKTREELNVAEADYTAVRIYQLKQEPIKGKFDLKHLQRIHKHIFQDIYSWAGKTRTVAMSKTGMFCLPQHIEPCAKDFFDSLKHNHNYLKNMDTNTFTTQCAHYLGEINALHPFREGNGRTQRVFIEQLAYQAGYDLNLSKRATS